MSFNKPKSRQVWIGPTIDLHQCINEAGEWIGPSANIQGPQGANGSNGTQGATGSGTQGTQGTSGGGGGSQGATGTQGADGAQGTQGTTGAGTQGASGAQGTSGGGGAGFTPGMIMISATPLSPPDWLEANGAIYANSTYPNLRSNIGLLKEPVTWVAHPPTSNITMLNHAYTIAYGHGVWITANGETGSNAYLKSTDNLVSWTQQTVSNTDPCTNGIGQTIKYANNTFIIKERNTFNPNVRLWTSSDNTASWTEVVTPIEFTGGVENFYFENTIWMLYTSGTYTLNSNSYVATSGDGITWTSRDTKLANSGIYCLAFGNNIWVAIGFSGVVSTSYDGVTWTYQGSKFSNANFYYSLAYGDGKFIAIEDIQPHYVWYSYDGINWNPTNKSFVADYANISHFYKLTYGIDRFHAVTDLNNYPISAGPGAIAYSFDGFSWVQQQIVGSPVPIYWYYEPTYVNDQTVLATVSDTFPNYNLIIYTSNTYSYNSANSFAVPVLTGPPIFQPPTKFYIKT
jgi:hypothetical protein